MSFYAWEEGTIVIPRAAWAKFRTTLIKAWNRDRLRLLEDAKRAKAAMVKAAKGKRGSKRDEAVEEALERHCGIQRGRIVDERADDCFEQLSELFFKGSGDWSKIRIPKRAELGILPTSKDASIEVGGDASIRLSNKSHTMGWYVGENNKAPERAHRHPMARLLFSELNRMKWTRGSGGTIVGNDEYNQDSGAVGGGGNYVVAEYGPKAKGRQRRR